MAALALVLVSMQTLYEAEAQADGRRFKLEEGSLRGLGSVRSLHPEGNCALNTKYGAIE